MTMNELIEMLEDAQIEHSLFTDSLWKKYGARCFYDNFTNEERKTLDLLSKKIEQLQDDIKKEDFNLRMQQIG